MPVSLRRRSILLVTVLALCGGCATSGSAAPRAANTPSTAAAAQAIAVHCDESDLTSCLEKQPPGESNLIDDWAGDETPPATLLVDYYYSSGYWAAETTAYEQAGIQAAEHETYQSSESGKPWASVTVARFADARGAATQAVNIELDGLDVTGWSGKRISVPGLPGYVYPGTKKDAEGYLRADYAASVGNLLMIFDFFSRGAFDQKDFAVWAQGQYLSLKSATAPAAVLAAGPAAALSCPLASCLVAIPAGDLAYGGALGESTSVDTRTYVSQMYSASRQPMITDELAAEGLTQIVQTDWMDWGDGSSGMVQTNVILLRFSSDQGAQLQHDVQLGALQGTGTFTVPGPGAAEGQSSDTMDSAGNYDVAVYGCVGAVEVEVHVFDTVAPDRADAVSIARRQLAQLAAHTTAS